MEMEPNSLVNLNKHRFSKVKIPNLILHFTLNKTNRSPTWRTKTGSWCKKIKIWLSSFV